MEHIKFGKICAPSSVSVFRLLAKSLLKFQGKISEHKTYWHSNFCASLEFFI
jgi:hypothetical protein